MAKVNTYKRLIYTVSFNLKLNYSKKEIFSKKKNFKQITFFLKELKI